MGVGSEELPAVLSRNPYQSFPKAGSLARSEELPHKVWGRGCDMNGQNYTDSEILMCWIGFRAPRFCSDLLCSFKEKSCFL